jgi:hypothetical protein
MPTGQTVLLWRCHTRQSRNSSRNSTAPTACITVLVKILFTRSVKRFQKSKMSLKNDSIRYTISIMSGRLKYPYKPSVYFLPDDPVIKQTALTIQQHRLFYRKKCWWQDIFNDISKAINREQLEVIRWNKTLCHKLNTDLYFRILPSYSESFDTLYVDLHGPFYERAKVQTVLDQDISLRQFLLFY